MNVFINVGTTGELLKKKKPWNWICVSYYTSELTLNGSDISIHKNENMQVLEGNTDGRVGRYTI